MKTEVSAGGVIVRKKGRTWEVLLISDMNSEWTFPKGIIEEGEDPQKAAIREVQEEVGLTSLKLLASLTPTRYVYKRGELIQKTVFYYLFTSQGHEVLLPQASEGISDAKWVLLNLAFRFIGYPKTNVSLLQEVQFLLNKKK